MNNITFLKLFNSVFLGVALPIAILLPNSLLGNSGDVSSILIYFICVNITVFICKIFSSKPLTDEEKKGILRKQDNI
ncbi:hypothetical protein HPDP_00902 [Candidatus Hepatincola sp. Pdp]